MAHPEMSSSTLSLLTSTKMSIPTAYATLSNGLPSKPYLLSITPAPSSSHLILRHPSSDLTIVDNQTLQAVDRFAGGHDGNVMDVKVDGAIWSGGKDAAVVRWDERSRRPATKLKGQSTTAGEGARS
jgi:hypothetical protein